MRIELELIGPEGTCILINDWDPQIQCYGICKDVTWDNFVDSQDFLTIMREYGLRAGLSLDNNSRACLEGAFNRDGYLYVVPVVVQPVREQAYLAAAKLELTDNLNYHLVILYDDPPLPGDNQERNSLREIEVDNRGSVYMTNAHHLNESDILWLFDSHSGVMKNRLDLVDQGNTVISDSIGLCTPQYGSRAYLASGENQPDAGSSVVYGLSADTLEFQQTIRINGMGHITSITEDPVTVHSGWPALPCRRYRNILI